MARDPPVLAALAAAIILAARATPRAPVGGDPAGDPRPARLGVASIVTPSIAGDPITPLGGGAGRRSAWWLPPGVLGARPALVRYLERRAMPYPSGRRFERAGTEQADRIGESVRPPKRRPG